MKTTRPVLTASALTASVAGTVAAASCIVAAFALSPAGAAAQQIDAGRLAVSENGQRVGVESFRVWRAGPSLNSVASIEPSGNRSGEIQVGVELDSRHRPVQYQRRGPGGNAIEGIWTVDRVRIHSITPDGERWREVPSRGPSTVLEVGVAHHHFVLLQVLQASGGRATVIVPMLGESADAELVAEQADEVSVGERAVAATRYDIRVGGRERRVWLDAEGRLLRVVDPSSGLEASRLPPR